MIRMNQFENMVGMVIRLVIYARLVEYSCPNTTHIIARAFTPLRVLSRLSGLYLNIFSELCTEKCDKYLCFCIVFEQELTSTNETIMKMRNSVKIKTQV